MKIIQILFLILLWVIPILLLINAYVKMEKREKQRVQQEFKKPLVLLTATFLCIGLLVYNSGYIISIIQLQHLGTVMILISLLFMSIGTWKKSMVKSIGLMLMAITLGIAHYNFLL